MGLRNMTVDDDDQALAAIRREIRHLRYYRATSGLNEQEAIRFAALCDDETRRLLDIAGELAPRSPRAQLLA